MRESQVRISLLLAAVAAAGVGVLALGTEATAQFWGWNRGGGWSNDWDRRDNFRDNRGGFREDWTDDRGWPGGWRRERDRNGGEDERTPRRNAEASTGSGYYCVRLCDGFYFPLARQAGGFSEAKTLCSGLCPATPTDVYSGRNESIGEARAQNGKTYASLPAAFAYRQSLKPDCGCRSATAKPLAVADDPTLRSGDIVVTESGVRVFQGASRRPYQAKDFVDYRSTRNVSGGLRSQLDAMAKRYYTTRAQATSAKKTQETEEPPPTRGRRGRR